MGSLLLARLSPSAFGCAVAAGAPSAGDPADAWSVQINAGYFDAGRRPIHLLRDGTATHAPFRPGTGGVLLCQGGRARIVPAGATAPAGSVAVQSTPRLIADGRAVPGVRAPDVVDGRAGVAIAPDGSLLVFATPPSRWGGASFEALRAHLAEHHAATDVLMLDSGSSARLVVRVAGKVMTNGIGWRPVPWSIAFVPAS